MAQDYTLDHLALTDFKDQHGNTWCDVQFKELVENVKWVVKDPSRLSEGQKYYGEIETKTSKAGKPYLKFKAMKKEDVAGTPENDLKQESISRSVALNNSVLYWQNQDNKDYLDVIAGAEVFYRWLKGEQIDLPKEEAPLLTDEDAPIDISEIPF